MWSSLPRFSYLELNIYFTYMPYAFCLVPTFHVRSYLTILMLLVLGKNLLRVGSLSLLPAHPPPYLDMHFYNGQSGQMCCQDDILLFVT